MGKLREDLVVAGEYFYEEPDLSSGVEGEDYITAYGADGEDEEQETEA